MCTHLYYAIDPHEKYQQIRYFITKFIANGRDACLIKIVFFFIEINVQNYVTTVKNKTSRIAFRT